MSKILILFFPAMCILLLVGSTVGESRQGSYKKAGLYCSDDSIMHPGFLRLFHNGTFFLSLEPDYGKGTDINNRFGDWEYDYGEDSVLLYFTRQVYSIKESKSDSNIFPGQISVVTINDAQDTIPCIYFINDGIKAYDFWLFREGWKVVPRTYFFKLEGSTLNATRVPRNYAKTKIKKITIYQPLPEAQNFPDFIQELSPECDSCNSFTLVFKYQEDVLPSSYVLRFAVSQDTIYAKDHFGVNFIRVKP